VLVLNKTDLISQDEQQQLLTLLAKLNPAATVVTTQHCKVPVNAVLHTGQFNWEAAQAAPGWVQEISRFEQQRSHQHTQQQPHSSVLQASSSSSGSSSSLQHAGCDHHDHDHHEHGHHEHAHESEAAKYGISSFVYYAERPFHPGRLLDQALSQSWQGVLRSKGFYWLATRHDVMGLWQSAGGAWQGEPRWVAAADAIMQRRLQDDLLWAVLNCLT